MRMLRLSAYAFCLTSLVGCSSSAKNSTTSPDSAAASKDDLDTATDEELVREFLRVTGAGDMGKQVMSSMLESFRKTPNLPNGFIEKFEANVDPNELVNLIVPIYLKHFDRPTLLALNRFYRTPEGKNMISKLPQVTAEAMEAGKTWGKEVALRTLEELGGTPAGQ